MKSVIKSIIHLPYTFFKIVSGWLREGTIICPDCNDFCHSQSFSANSTFGCHHTIKKTSDYVGDKPLDEPCNAAISRVALSVLFSLLVFLIQFR